MSDDADPDTAKQQSERNGLITSITDALDEWKGLALSVVAILGVAATFVNAIEKQWVLVIFIIAGVGMASAVLTLKRKPPVGIRPKAHFIAWIFAVAIPLGSIVGLFVYTYAPRFHEGANSRIAVARFDGPALPSPYDSCRPSAMIVDSLSNVQEHYGNLTVFELPYSIVPDTRWANLSSKAHGTIESADVVIYGQYTLLKSDNKQHDPDLMLIMPRANAVPTIPLSYNSLPLTSWELQERTVPIADLCRQTSSIAEDAAALALAIVGTQLAASERFGPAVSALHDAKELEADSISSKKTTDTCHGRPFSRLCLPILEFYLANLDRQLGNYGDAITEYGYAADGQRVAPLLDLAELDLNTGHATEGLRALKAAAVSQPSSPAVLAIRSMYERRDRHPDAAMSYLDDALQLKFASVYDEIAVVEALEDRGGNGVACAVRFAMHTIKRHDFVDAAMVETLITFARYMDQPHRVQRIEYLSRALRIAPENPQANYQMGLALSGNAQTTYLTRAVYGEAYTDDDFLSRGEAAQKLATITERNDLDAALDYEKRALDDYTSSIGINSAASYAYWHRAEAWLQWGHLEASKNPKQASSFEQTANARAQSDYRRAIRVQPTYPYLLGEYLDSPFFKNCRGKPMAQCKSFEYRVLHDEYSHINGNWVTQRDSASFDPERCTYKGLR